MFKSLILGNHKFAKPLAMFNYMDIDDAFYNPLNPSEVIASAHPVNHPWIKSLVKLDLSGRVVKHVELGIKWGFGDLNVVPEDGSFLVTHGSVVEVRSIDDLSIRKSLRVEGIENIVSAVYDSAGRLWVLTTKKLYVVNDSGRPKPVDGFTYALSMDSQRAEPSRILVVADHGSHEVRIYGEDGALRASIPAPFPGGVRLTHDERLIISSGRVPNHVQLTLVLGATHVKPSLNWFSYLWDYGTIASNRADSIGFSKYLIQWSLSLFEVNSPLPKFKPYIIRLGYGRELKHVGCDGYSSPTPAPCLGRCELITTGKGRYSLELLTPTNTLFPPEGMGDWVSIAECLIGKALRIEFPGVYRVKVLEGFISDSWIICSPN